MQSQLPLPSVLEGRLLEDLIFEDDQWLWEIVWRLNADFPQVDIAEKVSLAKEVTWKLFEEGQVVLLRGQWPSGPTRALEEKELDMLREQTLPWLDPEHSEILVVITRPVHTSSMP
jgi:hypothetical protein